jgi:hypothetical protein
MMKIEKETYDPFGKANNVGVKKTPAKINQKMMKP